MPMSIHLNPFEYIRNESDIMSIAGILMKATTPQDDAGGSNDQFFEQSAEVLLTSLIYLIHYYPMRLLNKLLNNTKQPDLRAILITCAAVLITLAVSWLCYRLIEKKLTVWLKEKLIGQ